MDKTCIPQGYAPCLNLYDTQRAISLLNRLFEDNLGGALRLHRVSAPLFVEASTGLNDDLNGVERAVTFDIPAAGRDAQVVHSLAKWKRMALYRYQFSVGEGLYTNMNAIRRDEAPDNLHSIYVDQWDWEKVIAPRDRTEEYLKDTVRIILRAVCQTEETLRSVFPQLTALPPVSGDVSFVTAQELEDRYPGFTPKEREDAWVKEHPTTFLMGIGGPLRSGKPHDGRAPDYDDWTLNGDILLWNSVLERAFEISSMGIRVSPEVLDRQLTAVGCDDRRALSFHKLLLEDKLPLTIGGGIGQSRLCMLLLGKAHIGEVQASVWDDETIETCRAAGVILL
jgi:aspartate--ammonia ligase